MDGTLNWSLPDALAGLGTLPVRLLDEEGRIKAQGLSGHDVPAAPGQYYLACTLPNGREIVRRKPLVIEAGKRIDPSFPFLEFDLTVPATEAAAPGTEQPAAPESGGVLSYVAGLFNALRGRPDPADAPAEGGALLCEGDWMHQGDIASGPSADAFPGAPILAGGGSMPLSRPLDSPADRLIRIEGDTATRYFIVPFDWPIGGSVDPAITVGLRTSSKGGLRPHFTSPVSEAANAYAEFVANGLLDQAGLLAVDLLDRSHQAMREGGVSALQAILSAYVLLRANALEGLETRVERLTKSLCWIPDVRVIEAEALARLGRHGEAVTALHGAVKAGCPWFRSGISYLVERLRFYVEVDAEASASFSLSAEDKILFRERRDYFQTMARRLDTASLFTAFAYPHDEKP